MSLVRVDFRHTESEQRHWKELESIFEGSTIRNFGKESVLLAGFFIRWGLKGSKCALDCDATLVDRMICVQMLKLTLEHVLSFTTQNTCPHLQILTLQELCDGESRGAWRTRSNRLLLLWRLRRLRRLGLLCHGCLLGFLLGFGLLLEFLDKLRDGHSILFCVDSQLSFHSLDLFWSGLLLSRRKLHPNFRR